VSLAAATLAADPPPAYVLETAPARKVEGLLTYDIQIPEVTVKEWLIFAAKMPELPSQSKVSSTIEPPGKEVRETSLQRRPLLLARIPAKDKDMQTGIRIKVKHQATLMSRNLTPRKPDDKPPQVAQLPRETRRLYVSANPTMDFQTPPFQKWLTAESLRRTKGETDIDFARRAFLHLKKNFTYEFKEKMDRKASAVCTEGKTDCGGLSVLYSSILRANDIPARVLVGRWAESIKPGQKIGDVAFGQTHAKAEFFADGVGWVPVDVSSAILHDKTAEGLLCFGHDQGDFFVFHVDPALTIDTILFGKKDVEYLQSVVFWLVGKGSTENRTLREDWQVRITPEK
jgi:transglutaminase-like putative cysteine protease